MIVSDDAGSAIITWMDFRSRYPHVYAQHVFASGGVDPVWPTDGRALSTVAGGQFSPSIVADGLGGAIVTWGDHRGAGYDIYAQRVARHGYLGAPEPEIVSVRDVPSDQGGKVKLSWNASYLERDPYNLVTYYKVFRSAPPHLAASLREAGAHMVRLADPEAEFVDRPGDLFVTTAAGTTHYWEYLARVNADFLPNYSYVAPTAGDSTGAGTPPTAFMVQARTAGSEHWESLPMSGYSVADQATPQELSFALPSPNPAGVATTLRYELPRVSPVRLAVHDAAGRLVRELSHGAHEAGEHVERWDLRDAGGRPVGAGLYFARLEVEGRALVRRVAVMR
jgi:hypothetical protein